MSETHDAELMTDAELEQTAMGLIRKMDVVIPALAPAYLGCASSIFNYLAAKQKKDD